MKKIISITLAVVMLLSLVLAMTSCKKFKTVDDIKKAGELVVYTEAGFAPYEFIYNNEIIGVDIAIMKAVADELGVKLVIKDVNFDTIVSSVQAGKADVGAAGITIRPDRAESVDFSKPYSSTEQYVIVAAGTAIPSVEDLAGKQIGVQQGTTSDFMIEELISSGAMSGATLTPYTAPALAAAAIGKIDAVVTDKLTAENIINASNGKLVGAKLVKADGSAAAEVEEYGIAVAKGNTELLEIINKIVTKLLADGTIEKWTNEYSDIFAGIEG